MIHNFITGNCPIADMYPEICRQKAVEMYRENLVAYLRTNEISTAGTLFRQNILINVCQTLLKKKCTTSETQTDLIEQKTDNLKNVGDVVEKLVKISSGKTLETSEHIVLDEPSSSSSGNTLIIDLEENIDEENIPRKKARYDFLTKSTEKIRNETIIRIQCDKDCRLARKRTSSKYLH